MTDKINPTHYKGLFEYKPFEVIDLTQYLDFIDGNIVKYVLRAGEKDGESWQDDLKKAEWYIIHSANTRQDPADDRALAVFDLLKHNPEKIADMKWTIVYYVIRKDYSSAKLNIERLIKMF